MFPTASAYVQMPEMQAWPVAHGWLHIPQFATSDERSAHPVGHETCPVGHVHSPPEHVAPDLQPFPQLPQFAASELVFEQAPAQQVLFAGQSALVVHGGVTQTPFWQTWCGWQAWPQVPQLVTVVVVSTQVVPQRVVPCGQSARQVQGRLTQCPFRQTWPGEQTWPHLPQASGSIITSRQRPLQATWPG
jgi:hypothetical protein